MTGPEIAGRIDRQCKVMQIIWGALCVSVCFYFVISLAIPQTAAFPSGQLKMILLALGTMAIGAAGGGTLIHVKYLTEGALMARAEIAPPAGGRTGEEQLTKLLGEWMSWNIVSWALFESIAIFGLMLYLIGASRLPLIVFCVTSLGLMFLNRPNAEELKKALEI
jgi:hypothetical protein